MKKSKILMIAAAAALLILLITAVVILKGDGTGPSITIPSDIEYHKGMSDSELLNGVTAEDSKDGDVSDTLIVESVIILSSGDSSPTASALPRRRSVCCAAPSSCSRRTSRTGKRSI